MRVMTGEATIALAGQPAGRWLVRRHHKGGAMTAGFLRSIVCAAGMLTAATTAFAPATRQAVPVAPVAAPAVQGFSVVLVLGSLKPGAETFAAELPRGATRALSDMATRR